MRMRSASGVSVALVLGLLLELPAFPQSGGYGSIGPSKGEVIGGIAGGAAVLGVVGYLIYHETHKHPTVTGCLTSNADGLYLANEKDNKVYTLTGNLAGLEAGEKVAIRGKKVKAKDARGELSFAVEKLAKDLGACRS